jgi:hypothetical protein
MSTSTKSEHGLTNPEVTYEKRDVNTRTILIFVAVLFAVLVVTFVSMRGLFGYFSATQNLGPGASPFDNSRALPPTPRLQVDPAVDLEQVRGAQEEMLNSYGWVDKANGTVHVPIDRAMDMLMERKLPVRQNAPAPTQSAESAKKEAGK